MLSFLLLYTYCSQQHSLISCFQRCARDVRRHEREKTKIEEEKARQELEIEAKKARQELKIEAKKARQDRKMAKECKRQELEIEAKKARQELKNGTRTQKTRNGN